MRTYSKIFILILAYYNHNRKVSRKYYEWITNETIINIIYFE